MEKIAGLHDVLEAFHIYIDAVSFPEEAQSYENGHIALLAS